MNDQVARDGGKFILVILPIWQDLDKLAQNTTFRNKWYTLISSICGTGLDCIDLSGDMLDIPKNQLDNGYDGTHFGPKTNRHIARFIKTHLEQLDAM